MPVCHAFVNVDFATFDWQQALLVVEQHLGGSVGKGRLHTLAGV